MDEDAKKKIDELIAAGEKLIREAKCKRLDLAKERVELQAFQVRLPKKMHADVKVYCAVHNISLNQLIERMCRDVIKDYGKCI